VSVRAHMWTEQDLALERLSLAADWEQIEKACAELPEAPRRRILALVSELLDRASKYLHEASA
jgi:hypothetical protein